MLGPSAATCTEYISTCAFNGMICANAAPCISLSLGSFVLCNAATDGAGNACGWAAGSLCKAKACSDAVAGPSAVIC